MKTVCPECNGSKWVNAVGAKVIPTVEADPFKLPCPVCQAAVLKVSEGQNPGRCPRCVGTGVVFWDTAGEWHTANVGDVDAVQCSICEGSGAGVDAWNKTVREHVEALGRMAKEREAQPQAPTSAAYQPEALALLGRTVAAVEQAAAEAKPTAEETAAWEAEKAAQVAARDAHKAHLDRAEQRALKSLAIEERKAAALEQIAKEAVQIATLLENLNNMAGWPR